jgi:hypothetical protein
MTLLFVKRKFIVALILLFLTSCMTGKVIEGAGIRGVKAKESLKNNSSIIFGRIKVYDKSDTLSQHPNKDLSDSCTIYVNNDHMYHDSLFYRYNMPEKGHFSNIYNGLFAIQIDKKDLQNGNQINIACGTKQSLRRTVRFIPDLSIISRHAYLNIDLEKYLNINSFHGEAIYLGDIDVVLPKYAEINKEEDMSFKTKMLIFFLGKSATLSRDAIDYKIDSSAFTKDNYDKTSKDLMKFFPFIQKDFKFRNYASGS